MTGPASTDTVLVCFQCTQRIGGGFGPRGRTPLAKALRRRLGFGWWRRRRAGIAEVNCMGVCPRRGVTVAGGALEREWLIVPAGADLDAVAAELGLTNA